MNLFKTDADKNQAAADFNTDFIAGARYLARLPLVRMKSHCLKAANALLN